MSRSRGFVIFTAGISVTSSTPPIVWSAWAAADGGAPLGVALILALPLPVAVFLVDAVGIFAFSRSRRLCEWQELVPVMRASMLAGLAIAAVGAVVYGLFGLDPLGAALCGVLVGGCLVPAVLAATQAGIALYRATSKWTLQ